MPRFIADDPVKLRQKRVSQAGGKARTFTESSVGRVCKAYGTGFCCVQFATQCLRIHEDFLEAAPEPAPECTDPCRAGC
jgi:hypothetical protein